MGRSSRLAAAPGRQSRVTSTDGEDKCGNHRKIIWGGWIQEILLAGAWGSFSCPWIQQAQWLAMLWNLHERFLHPFLSTFFTHWGLLCPSAAASEKQHRRRQTAWCLNPQQTSVSLFFSLIIQRNPCSLLFPCSIPSLAGVAYNRRVLPLPVSELWVCKSANSGITSGRLSRGDQWCWEEGLCSCLSFPALHTPAERRGE